MWMTFGGSLSLSLDPHGALDTSTTPLSLACFFILMVLLGLCVFFHGEEWLLESGTISAIILPWLGATESLRRPSFLPLHRAGPALQDGR